MLSINSAMKCIVIFWQSQSSAGTWLLYPIINQPPGNKPPAGFNIKSSGIFFCLATESCNKSFNENWLRILIMSSRSNQNSIDYNYPVKLADGVYWVGYHDPESSLQCNPYINHIWKRGCSCGRRQQAWFPECHDEDSSDRNSSILDKSHGFSSLRSRSVCRYSEFEDIIEGKISWSYPIIRTMLL